MGISVKCKAIVGRPIQDCLSAAFDHGDIESFNLHLL